MRIDDILYCNICGQPVSDDGCLNCDPPEDAEEFTEDDEVIRELDFSDMPMLPEYSPDFDQLDMENEHYGV